MLKQGQISEGRKLKGKRKERCCRYIRPLRIQERNEALAENQRLKLALEKVKREERKWLPMIMSANEVVDLMKKRDSGGLLLKPDFSKAYDNIDWSFLFNMLQIMGFGS